jgi:hypothetical protein
MLKTNLDVKTEACGGCEKSNQEVAKGGEFVPNIEMIAIIVCGL